jgi:hypothetical protein
MKKPLLMFLIIWILSFIAIGCNSDGSKSSKESSNGRIESPSYLEGCKKQYPKTQGTSQVGYHGIFPGQTTDVEVENILGKYDSQYDDIRPGGISYWYYGSTTITLQNHLVVLIETTGNTPPQYYLADLLKGYGCPDVIYATYTIAEDNFGSQPYDSEVFVYHNLGIEYLFRNKPVSLSDEPFTLIYFKPGALEEFLEGTQNYYISLPRDKPIDWEDAIKTQPIS